MFGKPRSCQNGLSGEIPLSSLARLPLRECFLNKNALRNAARDGARLQALLLDCSISVDHDHDHADSEARDYDLDDRHAAALDTASFCSDDEPRPPDLPPRTSLSQRRTTEVPSAAEYDSRSY